jgi:hypothetical protein
MQVSNEISMIRRNDSQLVNLFGWLPGCPAGGLDKRSLLGSCGQHFALLLTGPATDMGRVITPSPV